MYDIISFMSTYGLYLVHSLSPTRADFFPELSLVLFTATAAVVAAFWGFHHTHTGAL